MTFNSFRSLINVEQIFKKWQMKSKAQHNTLVLNNWKKTDPKISTFDDYILCVGDEEGSMRAPSVSRIYNIRYGCCVISAVILKLFKIRVAIADLNVNISSTSTLY